MMLVSPMMVVMSVSQSGRGANDQQEQNETSDHFVNGGAKMERKIK